MISERLLLVPGLPRCATTSLVNVLQQSKDISVGLNKEPHYFLTDKESLFAFNSKGYKIPITSLAFNLSLDSYKKNYKYSAKYTLDGSTLYSAYPQILNNIVESQLFNSVNAILTFRTSLSRAYSHYCFSISRGEEYRSFIDALNQELENKEDKWLLKGYIAGSRLKPFTSLYKDIYGIDNLLLIDLDRTNLVEDATLNSICKFLGIENFEFEREIYSNKNIDTSSSSIVYLRTLLRKIRQLNPSLVDNKINRSIFNFIMAKLPKNNSDIEINNEITDEHKEIFKKIDIENQEVFKEFKNESSYYP